MIISLNAMKFLGQKLQKALHSLDESTEVPFEDLFSDGFMQEHSKFKSVEEFQQNLKLPEIDSLEILSDEDADKIVAENTDFNDWETMKNTAGQEYVDHLIQSE